MSEATNRYAAQIAEIAGPRGWSDTRESWLARAARRTGLSYRTIKSLFHGEMSDPRGSVIAKLDRALSSSKAALEAQNAALYQTLIDRIATLETRIDRLGRASDADDAAPGGARASAPCGSGDAVAAGVSDRSARERS